jgi:hypothetical protein
MFVNRGEKISQKSRGHVKILGARKVTCSKFHIEDPQITGASRHNIDARATWRLYCALLAVNAEARFV